MQFEDGSCQVRTGRKKHPCNARRLPRTRRGVSRGLTKPCLPNDLAGTCTVQDIIAWSLRAVWTYPLKQPSSYKGINWSMRCLQTDAPVWRYFFFCQTKRMFWIIPNFAAVSADTQLPPLTAREKYALAMQDSVDYSSFVWSGMLAAQSMALRSYPEFHNGMAGYSRYYWRAFADQASGSFFTDALVPAVTHEDPRYYTLGHGGFFRRTRYALSRVVVTKTDSGGRSFNFSEIVGNALEAGLSNLYYPPEERSLHNTAMNWVAQLEAASINNIVREFWPDIRHKLLRQK